MRVFLGWLRGERGHCGMVAIPTLEDEGARRPSRERESLVGERTRIINENGRSMSLVITRAGRDAIGIERAVETDRPVSNKSSAAKRADRYLASAALRAGSKQSLVVEMLSKHQGTTLDALVKATGWLPQTTRAALTGLRKRGFAIERIRNETKGSSLYRIANGPNAAAGA
jgi:Protein of unknown function (DUF3489)